VFAALAEHAETVTSASPRFSANASEIRHPVLARATDGFTVVESSREEHMTPCGNRPAFTWIAASILVQTTKEMGWCGC
jgi:hypothetical protein